MTDSRNRLSIRIQLSTIRDGYHIMARSLLPIVRSRQRGTIQSPVCSQPTARRMARKRTMRVECSPLSISSFLGIHPTTAAPASDPMLTSLSIDSLCVIALSRMPLPASISSSNRVSSSWLHIGEDTLGVCSSRIESIEQRGSSETAATVDPSVVSTLAGLLSSSITITAADKSTEKGSESITSGCKLAAYFDSG